MLLVDLEETDAVFSQHRLASATHPAPIHFRRRDYLGRRGEDLDQSVRKVVEAASGTRPCGPVMVLTNVRTWGFLFNPISLYFCLSPEGAVEHLVAAVENTPWHDTVSYVVGPPGRHRFAKQMHVSPFLPMDVDYELTYTAPGEHLSVSIDVWSPNGRIFTASLVLERHDLDKSALTSLMWRHPLTTHKVTLGIYAQAARLVAKRAPFFTHPGRGRRSRVESTTETGTDLPR